MSNNENQRGIYELISRVSEIEQTLKRAYPKRNQGKFQVIYSKFQHLVKLIGIPALILASILPIYDLIKGAGKNFSRDLLLDTYIDYSNELVERGFPARAEDVLMEVNSIDKMTPRTHYSLAKIRVKKAILSFDEIDRTQDLLQVLINLNENSNMLTGLYGDKRDLVLLNHMLADLHIAKADYIAARTVLDGVGSQIANGDNDMRVQHLLKLGTVSVWEQDYVRADSSLDSSLRMSMRSGFKDLLGEIYFQKAKNYQFEEDFFTAIKFYHSSISYFKIDIEHHGLSKAYNNLGMIFFNVLFDENDSESALYYYSLAQEYAETAGDLVSIARCQYNIAVIRRQQGEIYEALQVYILSLANFEKGKNDYGVATVHSALGRVYHILDEDEKAYEHAKQAFEMFIQIKFLNSLGGQAGNLAVAARELGNEKDYFVYNYLAYIYRKEFGDSQFRNNMSIHQRQLLDMEPSKYSDYLEDAQRIARDINMRLGRTDIELAFENGAND